MQRFLEENKQAFLSIAGLVVILALAFWVTGQRVDRTVDSADYTQNQSIKYQGEEGKTALELLKAGHQVQTKQFSGLGEYVTAIDGKTADSLHFWSFYVNDKMAETGADKYVTKKSETIEWKFEEIK